MTAIQDVGDLWAKNISKAFEDWAAEEQRSRNSKIMRFDPMPLIESAFYEGGEAQLKELGKMLGSGVSFDLRSPEAEAWVKKFGAEQIKLIDATTKQTIRQITLQGLQEGLTPQEQSKLIRQHIGLLPQHATAVENYRQSLLKGGIDPEVADRLAAKYTKKLIKWRADTIGLTESHTAANEGSRQSTEGAVERGIITKDEYENEWLTAADESRCDRCAGMQGKRAEIGGTFSDGSKGPIKHQRCRCTTVVVAKSSKPYIPKVAEKKEETKAPKEPKASKKGGYLRRKVTDELVELTIKGSPKLPGEKI